MRQLSFASVILTVVLTALISASGALLFLAYQGSQKALQAEIKLIHERDAHLLQRMADEYQSGIGRLTAEIATRNDIRSSLLAGDMLTIDMVLTENLHSASGQQMDAMVIASDDDQKVVVNNSSLLGLDLPLQDYTSPGFSGRNWDTLALRHKGTTYHFIRFQAPVISPRLGEVIGSIYTFVLLNDNFWLLSESLSISGASAAALMTSEQLLGIVESDELSREALLSPLREQPIETLPRGTKQAHHLRLGNKQFDLRLYKADHSLETLSRTYNHNLWAGAVMVIAIAMLVMLLLRSMTNRSLVRLTRYAELAPKEASTPAFPTDRFTEFNQLGKQIEAMLKDIRAQENQLDAIFHHTPSAMFLKSLDLRYLTVNHQFEEIFGQQGISAIGQDDYHVFPTDEANLVRESDRKILSTQQTQQNEYKLTTRQGQRHFLSTKFPLIDDQGMIYGIGGITTDITDKVAAEQEAQITQMVFEAAAEAILIINPQGPVITNSSFSRITGLEESKAEGFVIAMFRDHPEIEMALHESGRWQGESIRRRADGEPLPVWISISSVDSSDQHTRYVAVFSDISELKAAERKLEKLAHYDTLTNLPNRTLFYDRIESSLARSIRNGKKTALLFLNLDRFKHVNDNYGHQAGDQMLIESAQRISQHIRPGDTVSRLGGDEFTVILSDLDSTDGVQDIARRIQQSLKLPYRLHGRDLFTSASIGIAVFPDDGKSTQTLLKHANTAMFHVKEQGRNDIMFFDKELNAQAEARIQLESSLRKAINSDALFPVFQPRFHISGQQVLSAEALIRWQHPSRGMIPPSEFIPLAESSGLIVELGRMMLEKACAAAQRWNQLSKKPVSVSVNLSARQLHDPGLLDDIRIALEQSGLDPALLELEITETMVIQDMDMVINRLDSIRQLGVNLSVDDFGTGYSSLIYLKRLPVSTVKIDKSFIDDVPGTDDGENLIKAVISMSHSLNLKVVAEGVEHTDQLTFLRQHQCDEVQGFLLAKPDSAERLEALLSEMP
ncbi:EAL domain-containing protein [Neptuniibacter halophilus]|uniref:EAL domain-containing protein n=1 Tax=Neptuniibacter halophilus TaxID=651666 RepID=UPI002573C30D|nr:EAL domain-containing protein [Neptuniibacter halophilus]